MYSILKILDSHLQMIGDKIYRFHKTKYTWERLDTLKPSSCGYIRIGFTSKTGKRKTILMNRIIYKFHNPNWNIFDNSRKNVLTYIDGNILNNKIENIKLKNE